MRIGQTFENLEIRSTLKDSHKCHILKFLKVSMLLIVQLKKDCFSDVWEILSDYAVDSQGLQQPSASVRWGQEFPERPSSWCASNTWIRCFAMCCSVLQCVALWYSVLQCVTVCCRVLKSVAEFCSLLHCVALCCSVLQCVAVCYSVLKGVAVCCRVLLCAGLCYSVLQRVAVCYSVLQCVQCAAVWLYMCNTYMININE